MTAISRWERDMRNTMVKQARIVLIRMRERREWTTTKRELSMRDRKCLCKIAGPASQSCIQLLQKEKKKSKDRRRIEAEQTREIRQKEQKPMSDSLDKVI